MQRRRVSSRLAQSTITLARTRHLSPTTSNLDNDLQIPSPPFRFSFRSHTSPLLNTNDREEAVPGAVRTQYTTTAGSVLQVPATASTPTQTCTTRTHHRHASRDTDEKMRWHSLKAGRGGDRYGFGRVRALHVGLFAAPLEEAAVLGILGSSQLCSLSQRPLERCGW